jgi:hypothetical protein
VLVGGRVGIAVNVGGKVNVAPITAVGVQVEVEAGMIPRSGANPTAIKPIQ